MKCRACDKILSDREATRKSDVTGEFLDLCDRDLQSISDYFPNLDIGEEDGVEEGFSDFPEEKD